MFSWSPGPTWLRVRNLFKKMLEGYPQAAVKLRDIMAERLDAWTRELGTVQRAMDKN